MNNPGLVSISPESRPSFGRPIDVANVPQDIAQVNETRCVGCGVCVPACTTDAMTLVRRPEEEILAIPESEEAWMEERAKVRGIDLDEVR